MAGSEADVAANAQSRQTTQSAKGFSVCGPRGTPLSEARQIWNYDICMGSMENPLAG
jgi:hypothetical protein